MMRAIPMVWRTLGIVCAFELVNLMISLNMPYSSGAVLLWFIWQGMAALGIGLCVFQMKKLKEVGQRMSRGNFDQKVDTKKMLFDFKEHGNDLNSIGDGMAIAVEQRMRSERLKTELITNVSHDLKTPLTAIITYVDLLKDDSLDEATRREYVATLEKKSQRLKRLIEDLFEMSKAASGSVTLHKETVELASLMRQLQFELEDATAACGVDFRWSFPPEKLYAELDGQKTFRVLENLVVNITKYALAGTRAYISLQRQGRRHHEKCLLRRAGF